MIEFDAQNDFILSDAEAIQRWIAHIITKEHHEVGDISYVFCDDNELHKINLEYLNHDTFTDIISFDYTVDKTVHGEIFISTDRVQENAIQFNVSFQDELLRVMIHGVFHFLGYPDASDEEKMRMRRKEDDALKLYLDKFSQPTD